MEAAVRWSPHSTGDRERFLIVDVADQSLNLNQIDRKDRKVVKWHTVARYGRLPNFGAFDWSKTDESLVAVGLVSGSACLIKLYDDGQSSEVVANFKIKQQRKCNSIALSAQDWLAVALDKTRSDVCLNVFDANVDSQNLRDPIRKLCPAEIVSSVRFFPNHPQEIVIGAQRSFVRLYDLRDGYSSNSGNIQAATRNVNNIAIDPLDGNYFASAGSTEDPSVTVWDKRWIAQTQPGGSNNGAVFEFRPAVDNSAKTTVWSLRYSGQRRGRLAICASTGELKIFDMAEGHSSQFQSSESIPVNTYGGTSWSCNRYVSQTRSIRQQNDGAESEPDNGAKLIAFDWMSTESSLTEQPVLALRSSREVGIIHIPHTAPHAVSTVRHDLLLAFDDMSIVETAPSVDSFKAFAPSAPNGKVDEISAGDYNDDDEIEANGRVLVYEISSPELSRMFAPSTVQRERCRRGYLFNPHRNVEIVKGNWPVERLWEIINRFQDLASNDGMTSDSIDLSFVGVSGLWSESIGNSPQRILSSSPSDKVEDAVTALNASRETPPFEGERTDFPEHRQLCLALCGWKFTIDTLEAECQELIDRGLYYQAIVQAVLHDYKHIALNILRTLIRSKIVPNIGLGALLASDTINDEQREMCLWMAADTDDPALKALLTFLTTGNWRDVMKTTYLHLGYRAALGLKYLNDTELSGFLQTETARAVKNGDLEGILLTGLCEQSMDLLQAYMTKTNDLQTVVLAAAFTNPLYVDDMRWEMWKETYFMQMQSWRAFNERAHFVVQHNRMARTRDGRCLVGRPPAQVTLRCNHCHSSLAKHDSTTLSGRTNGEGTPSMKNAEGPAASAGIVCPHCGRHMPRCGICNIWLGTPDPARQGGAKELQKLNNLMAKFITFCVRCGHGFHADHAQSWFKKQSICPVPDCSCPCVVK